MSSSIFQRNNDGYIIDDDGELILDIISQEPIKNYMIIQNQLYDIDILYDYIKYKLVKEKDIATIPHNRQPFTKEILEEIYSKLNSIKSKDKAEIIIELVELSKFSLELQEYLLILKYEQRRKILDFEDYKIQILISEPDYIIDILFNNYLYLLNDNISDQVIINAVKKYYNTLLFIPSERITDEIIKIAIKKNSYAIEYIHPNKMTYEIIELAISNLTVRHDLEDILNYMYLDTISIDIIKSLVQNYGYLLKYIPYERMTYEIIKLAVQNNGSVFEHVPEHFKTDEIIKIAIQDKYGYLVLANTPLDKITEEIIILALQNDCSVLKYVPEDKITEEVMIIVAQHYI